MNFELTDEPLAELTKTTLSACCSADLQVGVMSSCSADLQVGVATSDFYQTPTWRWTLQGGVRFSMPDAIMSILPPAGAIRILE
jgi:hypothetical protein